MAAVMCPYCGRAAELVAGSLVYPGRADLAAQRFYLCRECDASVGCHAGTETPLGTLANKALRRARRSAHVTFDQLWQQGGMSRSAAYKFLAQRLGIAGDACHISMFDEARCTQVEHIAGGLAAMIGKGGTYRRKDEK